MTQQPMQYYLRHLKDDLPAGIVVFLVALPLCLGIALASGAPLFAGLIAGMIVVATRNKRGFSGLFLSSFADRLLKLSPCDVLVLRPN